MLELQDVYKHNKRIVGNLYIYIYIIKRLNVLILLKHVKHYMMNIKAAMQLLKKNQEMFMIINHTIAKCTNLSATLHMNCGYNYH